jgi:hypothetical protein
MMMSRADLAQNINEAENENCFISRPETRPGFLRLAPDMTEPEAHLTDIQVKHELPTIVPLMISSVCYEENLGQSLPQL